VRVLIVRLGALGDIVHAVPAALAIASAVDGIEIDWLVERRHRPVLELFDLPIRPIDLGSNRPGDLWTVVRALRSRGYDAALDVQGLIKSALLARLSGARRVIGFARRALREPLAGLLYTEAVDPGLYGHVIQKNVALAGALGAASEGPGSIEMPLRPRASSVRIAGVPDPFAVLNPGAGWPNKRWPPERFGELAARLRRDHGLRVLVAWGPGEEPLARAVVEQSSGAADEAPGTELRELVALVRGARLMVSGDTGPLHLAAAAGTPLVGLFGPTDPRRNGPWSSADVSISQFHQCQCHHKRRCTRATRCVDDISVDDVMRAVDVRLERAEAARR
jgi:heptosyltransferase-1